MTQAATTWTITELAPDATARAWPCGYTDCPELTEYEAVQGVVEFHGCAEHIQSYGRLEADVTTPINSFGEMHYSPPGSYHRVCDGSMPSRATREPAEVTCEACKSKMGIADQPAPAMTGHTEDPW